MDETRDGIPETSDFNYMPLLHYGGHFGHCQPGGGNQNKKGALQTRASLVLGMDIMR